MSDTDMEQMKAALKDAFALTRAESRQLFDQVGQSFTDEVRAGGLLLGVDRGLARKFIFDTRSEAIGRQFGVSLRPARVVLGTVMLLESLCGLGLSIFAFCLLGWWGLAVLGLLPFVVWKSWQSAFDARDRGRLPKVLAVAFLSYGAYVIWEQLPALHLLAALVGLILFSATVAKYAYPTWLTRRMVVENPELCRILVEADIVVLRRPCANRNV